MNSFYRLGQKAFRNFVGFLVETMTPKGPFEINWHLELTQKANLGLHCTLDVTKSDLTLSAQMPTYLLTLCCLISNTKQSVTVLFMFNILRICVNVTVILDLKDSFCLFHISRKVGSFKSNCWCPKVRPSKIVQNYLL